MMRERFNLAFPSLLLVAVAVVQIVRAHTHGQSPWKGGGFGMFSTSDTPEARFVRTVLVSPQGEFPVPLPDSLRDEVTLARTVPTSANVSDLARSIADLRWVREDYSASSPPSAGDAQPKVPGEAPADPGAARIDPSFLTYRALAPGEPSPPADMLLAPTRVRVEIWRMKLDASGTHMIAVPVRSETLEP